MPTRKNLPHRRDQRRSEAQERMDARNKRTDYEQLKKLKVEGHEHCAEAKRLESSTNEG